MSTAVRSVCAAGVLLTYHCHVLEHEDHEMMRQMQVLPEPSTILGLGSGVLMLLWLARRGERRG